jgi:hypothetical protein
LKDNPMQMIYVDRDLGKWQGPSRQRQINLAGAPGYANNVAPSVAPDTTTGNPSLKTEITAPWGTNPQKPLCEGWYDAGPGNVIGSLYYAWTKGPTTDQTDANYSWTANLSTDDILTGQDAGAEQRAAGPGSGTLTATAANRRFAMIQFFYNASVANAASAQFPLFWQPAVYGNHGLTKRGAAPSGFYPSDIVRHVLSQAKGILTGRIDDATGYIAPHLTYPVPTDMDVIIDDMAKLMGWTWGVWEPPTIFDSQPRLDFRPPPTDATAVVTKAECDQLDITSRLGDLYDTAEVTYTDTAGLQGLVTVTLTNPQLYDTGIQGRTLKLDLGLGSSAAATTFGQFALALSQVAARAAGSATLPASVRLPGGGSKPASLLRPGLDRLRIVDLVDGGPLFDLGQVRRDVFRISRVETTVGKDGAPQTVAELDNGTNLLETLQARQSLAASVVGSGASGGG